ncbi:MAG: efflux RND transporter permease subunit [Calditrichaeota bacterium]|nr:MAG: efflux RND transporter permease subunit [Calditrichota bacterium]
MKITDTALKYRTSVFVLLFIVTILGITAYVNLPVESFPDIKQPVVYVAVPYLGVAPSDMETLVVEPIEDKLKEISQIKKLTSTAREGYASIIAEFEPDIDVDEAVRKVREKVDQAKPDLPNDLDDPLVQEINFENIPIMIVSITGDQSLVELKEIAEHLKDRIELIPGVLDVTLSGGLEREVQVDVIPARLQHYRLGVDDVIKAIRTENLTIPGGAAESRSLKWTVRVPGEFKSVDEIKNIVVKTKNGVPIYLKDVAEVRFGFKEQTSYSRLNGQPSVTLSIQKRSGENIIRITDEAKRILEEESRRFPPNTHYTIVTDFSEDIRSMVNDLENNIIAGLLLVVFVLYFFMGARNGLLVGIAIPLSMLISFMVIGFLGYTLNMVVLFSLILALGMLVDNAIVIVENIYRHHQQGKPLFKAAREATDEVGMAVVVSTATTLSAFLPLIFWEDVMGEFMKYLPITLIITLSCSLLVGLVFNPVLASRFLKLDPKLSRLAGDRFLRWLTVRYERTLKWALHHRWKTLGMVWAGFVGMIVIWVLVNLLPYGIEFFPTIEPEQIFVEVEAPLGTRLETSDAIVRQLEQRVADTPDMKTMVSEVGSVSNFFDFGTGGGASHKSRITIDLRKRHLRTQNSFETLEQVKQNVQGIPGARIDVTAPQHGPPTGKPVEIQIKGPDFRTLARLAEAVKARIADVPHITKIRDTYQKGKPELRIRIDREKAALLGLSTQKIANTIRTAINGTEASEFRVGTEEYDITVRFGENFRQSYNDLLNLTVFHEGVHYPLANFATIELASGLSTITHVDGDRVITVTAEALGNNASAVMQECKQRLRNFELPPGYTLFFAGQNEEQQKSQAFLMRAFLIAVFLIFLLLVTEFNSVTLPFVIMISVVLSFFGVFFGLVVTFRPFGTIMTGIGVISLAGVVVNNAIVLIDYVQKLRARGLSKFQALVEGGKTRLRPVLLTAITTILGLIPLTVGINIDFVGLLRGDVSKFIQFGAESSQWWSGMGIAVIFGLLFATALTLIVVPVMYYMLSDLVAEVGAYFRPRPAPLPEVDNPPEAMAEGEAPVRET